MSVPRQGLSLLRIPFRHTRLLFSFLHLIESLALGVVNITTRPAGLAKVTGPFAVLAVDRIRRDGMCTTARAFEARTTHGILSSHSGT